jgi:Raf kinase inhibitor-like YbhB/YbcL family protein
MRISRLLSISALALTMVAGFGILMAQDAGRGGGRGRGGRGGGGIPAPLKITIPAFADGSAIPTEYGCSAGKNANISPQIEWSGAPEGTQTIALIMHDPDVAIGDADVLHWAIFNIPASATGLPKNVPATETLDGGAVQLKNIGQSVGYFNPCPPPPTTHHYLFEFYALDSKLDLGPTASRADLMKAMTGHVRAKGLYVGLYHQ